MTADAQKLLKQHLEQLRSHKGIQGVLLITRDGLPVAENLRRPINRELFSAMIATILGAAEMALSTLGDLQVTRVVTETDELRMVITGVSDDYVLAVLTEPNVETESVTPYVKEAQASLAAVLK